MASLDFHHIVMGYFITSINAATYAGTNGTIGREAEQPTIAYYSQCFNFFFLFYFLNSYTRIKFLRICHWTDRKPWMIYLTLLRCETPNLLRFAFSATVLAL